MQAALPLGPYDLMVLMVVVVDRDTVWRLCQAPIVNHRRDLWDLGASIYHHLKTTILPLRVSSWSGFGP